MTASAAARELGDRMRIEREKLGATQEDLAHFAGIDKANYGRIERGTGNPNFTTLLLIAEALQTEIEKLVSGITADQLGPRPKKLRIQDWLRDKRRDGLDDAG
jgi:transcriptional regulator with XRE-family HTH domain